ncbi:hypothetical protein MMB17_07275 [Methylobacterium organophilum]|uniref:hypothetical protein n=1 Tax=Methylobacterium organophilum TaxID=410 RepID=UPI001F12D82A|nr:hypothetical protein [Methylobacterium organophilum]UMY19091.1 hypothetical protein MMB17_07275 [Methylobacterium organophilum]
MSTIPNEAIKAERQGRLKARIAEMRSEAAAKQATAEQLNATVPNDSAFWIQPALGNAAGRAFARRHDNARSKLVRAGELNAEATDLLSRADAMERAGARVVGDAKTARKAAVAACSVSVGEMVHTTHYGVRRVVKVNAKTVLVEGAFGPLKVEKQFVRKAA